jgi:hypothetical protein
MSLLIKHPCQKNNSATTFSIMTLSITTFNITINYIKHNYTQHTNKYTVTLSIMTLKRTVLLC